MTLRPIPLTRSLAWTLMAFLAAGVAVVSMRYALPTPPMASPEVMANPFARPFLPIHAITASIALLVGAFQFVRNRRGGRARWHRASGAVYMACCLASAPAGLLLALGTSAGPIASVGFGVLALVWFYATAQGLRALLAGRYAEHGEWMLRSYALTFAAVTLRLYLPLLPMLGIDFVEGYRAISYLCWIPNLLIAEAMIASRRRRLTTSAPA
jgi:uncharacterized membrane protein